MRAALLFLAFSAAAQAQTYYYTDNFASYNAGAWTAPGAVRVIKPNERQND